MADTTTIITGVADGAFENAFGELPGWATEETQEEVRIILTKLLKTQNLSLQQLMKSAGAKGQALTTDDLEDLNNEVQKLYKSYKKVNDDEPKRKKQQKEEEEAGKKNLKQWAKDLFSWKAMQAGIVYAGLKIRETMFANIKTFDELYRSGINVMDGFQGASTGFEALQQLSQITGVRFTELSATIVKYNTAVNAFGLGKFAKTIGQTKDELTRFGYNTKESAELLGSYLESQKGYTDVNTKNQEEVQKDLVKFGERITRLSQATGMARQKLLENVEALSQSVEASILAGQVGADASKATLEFVSSFKDQKVGQAFLRMMTDTIKPLNSTFMTFQKTGFGAFGMKFANLTRQLEGIADPEEKRRLTAEFARANKFEIKTMIERGNLFRAMNKQEGEDLLRISVGLQQAERDFVYVSKKDRDAANATAEASKKLQNEWERLMSQLQQAFIPLIPVLISFANFLSAINKGFEWLTKTLGSTTLAIAGVGIAIAGAILSIKLVTGGLSALANTLLGTSKKIEISSSRTTGAMGRMTSSLLGIAARVGLMMAAGAGIDYVAGKMGVGGKTIDEEKDEANWQKMTALEKAQSGIARGIEGAGKFFQFSNFANEAAAERIRKESEYLDKEGRITPPPATRIEGSSATPPDETPPSGTTEVPTATNEPVTTSSTSATDINSVLASQTKVLNQILDSTTRLNTTSGEILRFTKNRA